MTDVFTEANKKKRPISLTTSKRPKQQDSDNNDDEDFLPQQSQWYKRCEQMNGWIDRWMDGWIDEWMSG